MPTYSQNIAIAKRKHARRKHDRAVAVAQGRAKANRRTLGALIGLLCYVHTVASDSERPAAA